MFHSEQLQEKWGPVLDYEGLDKIEDKHKRSVTAVLLENQEKFLKETQAFEQGGSLLTEAAPTNSGGNPQAYSGAAAAAGPVAGFDPVLISLIRRAMPNLVAYDLAGVQPMSGPTGLIFAMRSRYSTMTGTETFYDEVDTAFSGQPGGGTKLTAGWTQAAVGMGTTSQSGGNPAVLNPTATADEKGYNVGQGMRTDSAEDLGDGSGDQFNQMAFSIEKVTVTAKSLSLIHI